MSSTEKSNTVLILLLKPFVNDNRVRRIAEYLSSLGFSVTIIAVQKSGEAPLETAVGYRVVHLPIVLNPLLYSLGKLSGFLRPKSGKFNFSPRAFLWTAVVLVSWTVSFLLRLAIGFRAALSNNSALRMAHEQFKFRRARYEKFAALVEEFASKTSTKFVWANDMNTLPAALRLFANLGIPFVYDSHELWIERNRPNEISSPVEKKWEMIVEKKALESCLFSVTVCDSIADYLSNYYGSRRPMVLRNIPDSSKETTGMTTLRSTLGLSSNDFLCVCVGSMTHNRGLEEIIEAVSRLSDRVKAVFIGPCASMFRKTLEARIRKLGVSDRIFLRDPVPGNQLVSWISSANLSLIPIRPNCLSYYFALPNKIFESLHAGLPLLGTHLPEISAVIERHNCGLTFKNADISDLVEKIERFANDPALVKKFKDNAIEASKQFSWEDEIRPIKKILADTFASRS